MNLVFFDLDGTIFKGQSQQYLIFYLYNKGWLGFYKLIILLFWFFGYKLHIFKDLNWPLGYSFDIIRNRRIEEVKKLFNSFYDEILQFKFNDIALKKLKEHQQTGDRIVLISSCVKPLAELAANKLGIREVISTELEKEKGLYTGKIKGEIVYGRKKAEIIKEKFIVKELKNSYAYADHYSDIFLLELVDYPVLLNASRKTLKFFKKNYQRNNLHILQ